MMEPWKERVLHVLGPESEHAKFGTDGADVLRRMLTAHDPEHALGILVGMVNAHTEMDVVHMATMIGTGKLYACLDEWALVWLAVRDGQKRTLS